MNRIKHGFRASESDLTSENSAAAATADETAPEHYLTTPFGGGGWLPQLYKAQDDVKEVLVSEHVVERLSGSR